MACFYPEMDIIKKFKPAPEPGELYLLEFLAENLDDEFEVYFQPFVNGDRPDIIIMRRNYGVLIIEVKDWDLSKYYLDDNRKVRVKNEPKAHQKNPIDQVLQYKKNLYNLHIPNLFSLKLKDYRYWRVVECAVYFHNATSAKINEFYIESVKRKFQQKIQEQKDDKIKNELKNKFNNYLTFFKKNIEFLGRDTLNPGYFEKLLRRRYLKADRESRYFNEELYKSIKRYLQPPIHSKEQGQGFDTIGLEKFIRSEPGKERVIKGVAGSGKTTVLAIRVVNTFKRLNPDFDSTQNPKETNKILILTYNITLINYIHDKISRVRENYPWSAFYINNYHNFIKQELNNHGIEVQPGITSINGKEQWFDDEYFSNTSLFERIKDKIKKYKAIYIDEIQDYKKEWLDIIKKYFLDTSQDDYEFVLFGDEKQNIYNRYIKDKDVQTNVKGRPLILKRTYRTNYKLMKFAIEFQKVYLDKKYVIDKEQEIEIKSKLPFGYLNYKDIKYSGLYKRTDLKTFTNAAQYIEYTMERYNYHPNDTVALTTTIKQLQYLEAAYSVYRNLEKTMIMTENFEEKILLYYDIFKEYCEKKYGSFVKQFSEPFIRLYLFGSDNLWNFWIDKYKIENNFLMKVIRHTFDCYHKILKINDYKKKQELDKQLYYIRQNKKRHFWFNSGTIKFSTVHSFKGWEARNVFLIIDKPDDVSPEIVYTGITRAKENLHIINLGNPDYYEIQNIIQRLT